MDLPEINPCFDQAVDTVVNVINLAKSRLGVRQNLTELAVQNLCVQEDRFYPDSRKGLVSPIRVPFHQLVHPLDKNGEKFLRKTIENIWLLTATFKYILRFMGNSRDEMNHYYYFEVVFSQPSPEYPIPQAIVTVTFRLEVNYTIPPGAKSTPFMFFRIEGQHSDHDVRYVALTPDWLASVLKMKIKLFKRIEELNLF